MNDPKLPFETGYCLCGSCGEYFAAEHSFTLHRLLADRACLSVEALPHKGFTKIETAHGTYWAHQ